MSNTILLGGSGFLGPVILSKDPQIISIGRSPIESSLKNKHLDLPSLDNLERLDNLDFDKVIFLIGSSNHHEINKKITMGIDYNVYPLQKILKYLSNRKLKKFICFTSMLLYDQSKLQNPVDEKQIIKSQAKESELIYLSKPLGTGYLLAAYFNNSELLSSFDFQKLMTWMKKGNKKISEISKSFKSKITTDISGFGLASHLSDICKSSGLSAVIKLNEEILINKNIEILNKFKSTGFENNYSSSVNEISISDNNKLQNILYDPQTNGPLLISIKKEDQIKFEKEFQLVIGFSPILIGQFKKFKNLLINVIN